jgi:AAA15 family ATPase/GTPase
MRLKLIRKHKSITSLQEIELPNFVILTGVNGAGKTHFIEAIENGSIQLDNIDLNDGTRPIRLFNWMNLVPQDTGAFAPSQLTQERYGLWSELSSQISQQWSNIQNALQQYGRSDLENARPREIINMKEEDLIKTGSNLEQARQIVETIKDLVPNANQNLISIFQGSDSKNRTKLVNHLQKNSNIPLIAFEENDFYNNFPASWYPVDVFQQFFSRLFADYQRNWRDNQLKSWRCSKGDSISFFTDEEFLKEYGEPPWDFVNSIFKIANLDFRINQPYRYEDRPYEPILTDQIRGTQVKFADLSSGERILMSFALCLYYAEDRRQLVDYPKVLLFDEIDAPLHPSMTQSLLRTIQDALIKRHGIKVIMTTHSPSTVALAPPEASLYAMSKDEQKRLQKTTKDKALAILTTGVPTLSIDFENRRQVFVESQYDVQYYEKIYEQLKNDLIPEISINFISSGVGGKGNCDQVKEVVNHLHTHGNKTVYGIIDWDLKNHETEKVKVLGQNNRRSIEHYILDPILVVAFLLREKFVKRSDIGLSDNNNYMDFARFDDSTLQSIADVVVDKVKIKIKPQTKRDKQSCEYVNGRQIYLPTWFLQFDGHELERELKEIFPQLNRFQKEPQLKQEILLKVIDDIPELIPKDFVLLFQKIQNFNSTSP